MMTLRFLEHVDAQQAVHAQALGRQHRQLGVLHARIARHHQRHLGRGGQGRAAHPVQHHVGTALQTQARRQRRRQRAAVGAGVDDEVERPLPVDEHLDRHAVGRVQRRVEEDRRRLFGGGSTPGGGGGGVVGEVCSEACCSSGAGVVDRAQACSAISDNPSPAVRFRRVSMGGSPCRQDNTVFRQRCRNPLFGARGKRFVAWGKLRKSEKAAVRGPPPFRLVLSFRLDGGGTDAKD
jgi:hypothetical protein